MITGTTTRLAAALAAACVVVSTGRADDLRADLDRLLDSPTLSRAIVAVRVDALPSGQVIYQHDADKLVMPASNVKLLTMAAAAERLGWSYTSATRLEAVGQIGDGVLHGDLVVTGGGDPSIAGQDFGASPLFGEWAAATAARGIRRVDGRLIGDDHFFDQVGLGDGWAWNDLAWGYAAPSGALSYNENVAVLRAWPGSQPGDAVRVDLSPPGHGLHLVNELQTGAAGSAPSMALTRLPGNPELLVRGSLPAGGKVTIATAAVDNPTRFFVDALRLALIDRGIAIARGAWDIDDVGDPPPATGRTTIAERRSPPLTVLGGYFMKVSQNFYAEMVLKTLARAADLPGSAENGRHVVHDTLVSWGIPDDAFALVDGSGLSRYDYATAGAIVTVLDHVWADEKLRGPFAAMLPVAGHDGTLSSRMRGTVLDDRVQAKTGTLAGVRALSGYLEAKSGARLSFSIVVNNFTQPASSIDAVVEQMLTAIANAR